MWAARRSPIHHRSSQFGVARMSFFSPQLGRQQDRPGSADSRQRSPLGVPRLPAYTGNLPHRHSGKRRTTVIGAPATKRLSPENVDPHSRPDLDARADVHAGSRPQLTTPSAPDANRAGSLRTLHRISRTGGLSHVPPSPSARSRKAAGGATNITTYCTTIVSPGHSATHHPVVDERRNRTIAQAHRVQARTRRAARRMASSGRP